MLDFLLSTLRSGTPLIYVTMAAVLAQRAGLWHLGLEGMMAAAACAAVVGTALTGSLLAGFALALAVPVIGAAVLWFTIERLKANAIIAGLGLSGLGVAGTGFALQSIFGSEGTVTSPESLPRLGAAFGRLADLSVLAAAMPVIVALLFILLCRTRYGLGISASGEHPFAAASVGIDPSRRRLVVLLLGGVLCGLGGVELALGSLHVFSVGMTAGRGYMAFAAAIFGAAHPVGSTLAALSFAFFDVLGIKAQLVLGNAVPSDLLLALPYVFTVVGVWLSGWLRGGIGTATSTTELRGHL